jgi:hypothetical protein
MVYCTYHQISLYDTSAILIEKFVIIILSYLLTVYIVILRQYSWSGIPAQVRPTTWQLLSVRTKFLNIL